MWGRFRVKIFRAFRRKCILTNNCYFSVVTDDYNDLSNTKREQFYSCYSKSRLVNELCMRRSNCSATIPSSRAPLGTSLFLWLPWSFYRFFQPCPALLNHFQMLGFNASYPQEFSYAPPQCIYSFTISWRLWEGHQLLCNENIVLVHNTPYKKLDNSNTGML